MRKLILISCIALSFSGALKAQTLTKGNQLFTLSYGVGSFAKFQYLIGGQSNFSIKGIGQLNAKFEVMKSNYFSLGIGVNYLNYQANWVNKDYLMTYTSVGNYTTLIINKYRRDYNSVSVLLRGNFYFVNKPSFSVFMGAGMGYKYTASYAYTNGKYSGDSNYRLNKILPVGAEASMGTRFAIGKQLGGLMEVGLTKSLIQVGLYYRSK